MCNNFLLLQPLVVILLSIQFSGKKPKEGWHKVNVDATIFSASGIIRLGWVLRYSARSFLTARGELVQQQLRPNEAKNLGIWEALSWINQSHLMKVVVEMDTQEVFNALQDPHLVNSSFAMLIADCQVLVKDFKEIGFSFVKRSTNSVTHFYS